MSDQLEITLRKGTSTRHEILRMLPSGTRLTVLKADNASGYSRVRTPSGVEGWVLNRFLMKNPSARDRLATAEKRLAELELQNRRLATKHQDLEQKSSSVNQERGELERTNRKLAQQLAEIRRTASSALAIANENKELKTRIVEAERNVQALQQENAALRSRTARDWFMVGAAVVLIGILIGLVIPRIRWRRRSSWDSL